MTARICTRLIVLLGVSTIASAQSPSRTDLTRDLDRLSRIEHVGKLPSADSVVIGSKTIPAGTTTAGSVVATGPIDVGGRVDGSVVSLGGNVILHHGGVVTGDVVSVGGRILADSGVVNGELRTMATLPTVFPGQLAAVPVATPTQRTMSAIRAVCGSFVILLVIACGVVLFASANLSEVVSTLESRFAHAFWMGFLGQIVALPVLAVILLALALSLIGILLIPFAIVAYTIAIAGLVTLGFLATARLVGGALYRNAKATATMRSVLALSLGVAVFFILWMLAAVLSWAPLAASVIRAAALAATWVATTVGLGATLISRAGTHRKRAAGTRPVELASWQTPTPVTGVVAARRVAGSREVH
jgi:hypothetical protein